MKKIILLITVMALFAASCSKHKVQNQIVGTWQMTEARLNGMANWEPIPATEAPVVITETHISNPWDTTYTVMSHGRIKVKMEVITVEIKKRKHMMWTSNGDSLRFDKL